MQYFILDFIVGLLTCLQVVIPLYIYKIIYLSTKKHNVLILGLFGLVTFIILKTGLYIPTPGTYWDKIIWGLSNVSMLTYISVSLQRIVKNKGIETSLLWKKIKKIFVNKK